MKRKESISHDEATVRELRDHPEFAAEYLRAALEDADEPEVLLIALRRIAKARGGWPVQAPLGRGFLPTARTCTVGEILACPSSVASTGVRFPLCFESEGTSKKVRHTVTQVLDVLPAHK